MTIKRYYRIIVLLSVFLVTAITMMFLDPIAQDLAYHKFSDVRAFFDIPYFMDVMSNMPFVVLGVLGFLVVGKAYKNKPMAFFLMTFTFFVGVFLTGIGSAFYHYAPNNFSLIFDRLPMTLVFTPFFATIIYDYVDRRAGAIIFYGLLLLGIYSILYWYYTEVMGAGDLRLYAFVQYFPVVAVPLILIFYKNSKLYTRQIIYAFGAYTIAKLCENFDTEIFEALQLVSGHTIKHLFSALAVYFIYTIYKRQVTRSDLD
jgi:hypothetical protein